MQTEFVNPDDVLSTFKFPIACRYDSLEPVFQDLLDDDLKQHVVSARSALGARWGPPMPTGAVDSGFDISHFGASLAYWLAEAPFDESGEIVAEAKAVACSEGASTEDLRRGLYVASVAGSWNFPSLRHTVIEVQDGRAESLWIDGPGLVEELAVRSSWESLGAVPHIEYGLLWKMADHWIETSRVHSAGEAFERSQFALSRLYELIRRFSSRRFGTASAAGVLRSLTDLLVPVADSFPNIQHIAWAEYRDNEVVESPTPWHAWQAPPSDRDPSVPTTFAPWRTLADGWYPDPFLRHDFRRYVDAEGGFCDEVSDRAERGVDPAPLLPEAGDAQVELVVCLTPGVHELMHVAADSTTWSDQLGGEYPWVEAIYTDAREVADVLRAAHRFEFSWALFQGLLKHDDLEFRACALFVPEPFKYVARRHANREIGVVRSSDSFGPGWYRWE